MSKLIAQPITTPESDLEITKEREAKMTEVVYDDQSDRRKE
jgi:hypothetical protein